MIIYRKYILFLLSLLAWSCSTEPISTGPYSYFCELNYVDYRNGYLYEYYCNPEGVKLYDSLKKESEFVSQYEHYVECKDTVDYLYKKFTLHFNSYTGFFYIDVSSSSFFFHLERGYRFSPNVLGSFLTKEKYFSDLVYYRYRDNVIDDKNIFSDKIPSSLFTTDPVESFEKAQTCDEQIALVQSFYEICRDWTMGNL